MKQENSVPSTLRRGSFGLRLSMPLFRAVLGSSLLAACVSGTMACASGSIDRAEAEANPDNPNGPSVEEWMPPASPPAGSPVAEHGQLRVEGTQIVDEAGEPVQLRGISTMWLNWETGFADRAGAYTWLRDNWDLQVIRGAMGVDANGDPNAYLANPTRGRLDMELVIRNAIDAGLYVIIDWHDHDGPDHQQEAVEFFSQMAQTWGDYPHVIYETFNEPLPNWQWDTDIKPFHEATLAAIREHDPDGIVVLGNRQWSQRPDEAIGNPVAGDNLLYTVHFYSCDHGANIRAYAQAALDAGLPIFVTEWGATVADGGVRMADGNLPPVCDTEADAWHTWMNQNGISWAAWKFEACDDVSCFFRPGAPLSGEWTDDHLNGHGPYVRDKLLAP